MPKTKFARFRDLLRSPELSLLIEAHNALSAKIAEEAGFAGIWASGLTMSAALGVRDNNEASWTQVLEILEFMADATAIPILVDGDTGYGNFNNVRRLVRKLCQRGIAAVCIEDKLFPKTNSFLGENQPLADIEEFCGKIKAGKDSQLDDDFSIIARIEALIAGRGLDEALRRAEAYHRAGADGILIHSKSGNADEVLAFKREWGRRAPVLIVPTTYHDTPTERFREAGISVVICANHNLRAAITAMRETSRRIFADQGLHGVEGSIASVQDVFNLCGSDELEAAERRYLPEPRARCRTILLAASPGFRVDNSAPAEPAAMLDVRGKPALHRLVSTLNGCGLRDVTVVRGYRKEAIDLPGIRMVDHDAYAATGDIASLACASDWLADACLVSYGDILFRGDVLEGLLAAEGDIVLAVDAVWRDRAQRSANRWGHLVTCSRPFSGHYFDDGPVRLSRVVPNAGAKHADGEWIGLVKFSARGAQRVKAAIETMTAKGSLRRAGLTDLFARLLAEGQEIRVAYSMGRWLDVRDGFGAIDARPRLKGRRS